jgi:hypothetical protein
MPVDSEVSQRRAALCPVKPDSEVSACAGGRAGQLATALLLVADSKFPVDTATAGGGQCRGPSRKRRGLSVHVHAAPSHTHLTGRLWPAARRPCPPYHAAPGPCFQPSTRPPPRALTGTACQAVHTVRLAWRGRTAGRLLIASDLHGEDEQLDRLRRLERAVVLHFDLESTSAAQDMSGKPNDRNEPTNQCARKTKPTDTAQKG